MSTKKTASKAKKAAKNKKIAILGGSETINVYASPRILTALTEATLNLDVYQGVKLGQVLDAVYKQGKKDDRREFNEGLHAKLIDLSLELPFRNPGQPKKQKRT